MTERGIPRQGYKIYSNGELAGEVTSGTFSPSLEKSIGMGYLKRGSAKGGGRDSSGLQIQIEIRNTLREARVVELPFYKKD